VTAATVTVIETFDDEEAAMRAMHRYAANLRKLRRTSRYGTFIEHRAGVWYLCLADRGRGGRR
jgi:hypothetical protein